MRWEQERDLFSVLLLFFIVTVDNGKSTLGVCFFCFILADCVCLF